MRIFTLLCLLVLLSACNHEQATNETDPHAGHDHAMHSAISETYVCPMHPQIVRDEEGTCPICGMDLVKKKVQPLSNLNLEPVKKTQTKFVCPMHPQIVRDEEGSCPICGMDLVEKQIEPQQGLPTIAISPAVMQSMGVRTAQVKKGRMWKYIKTVGQVTYNEDKVVHVHPRASGWVEKLNIRREGDPIKKGNILLRFYSPEILEAQQDFLVSLRLNQKMAGLTSKQQRELAKNRLRLLEVPEPTINRIAKKQKAENNIAMLSPQSGIVTKLNIREGMYITPNTELFTIADLSTIWVLADIYEYQLDWIKQGLDAEITVPALPSQKWEGKVDYIYPELNPTTRTLKVRLAFKNKGLDLKPNMFAKVIIYGGAKRDILKIDREALIVTGEREAVVLALGEGKFKSVDVVTGMHSNDEVEILSGLEAGDKVVVSGQFLIDSEANLQASFMRMGDAEMQGGAHAHH
ncbi:efflux RND transporter periplasmic adaptor subunit [Candidatus Albibeggiatoa sp. nov. NOAA]|uniref:efflux RND transporter periplasmic adaptor subunit n=1 Tax=Candidatus Albibeggiatoa sp. nov. NOAA TaxID=3162724 RepID=UPI0033011896|nr:efflux RND transporter periplasmic adaptor subunit [Thiotrichaceae bacterium]